MARHPFFLLSRLLLAALLALSACHRPDPADSDARLQAARRHFQQGDYEKARVDLRSALQAWSGNGAAWTLLGDTYLRLLRSEDALAAYRKAFELDAGNWRAGLRLGLLQLDRGQKEAVEAIVERLASVQPDTPASLILRARLAALRYDLDQALTLADRAGQKAPDVPDIAAVRADLHYRNGDIEQALHLAQQAWQAGGDEPSIRDGYLDLLLHLEQWDQAERILRKAIPRDPHNLDLRQRLVQVLLAQGRPDAAETFLRRTWQALPGSRRALALLTEFLVQQHGLERALAELERLQRAAKDGLWVGMERARLLRAAGRLDEAARVYEGLLQREKRTNPRLLLQDALADLRWRQGRTGEARRLVEQVLARSPRDPDALTVRARLALADQRPLDAITDLRTVLKARPADRGARYLLARAHLMNGEPILARENLLQVLAADPKDVDARLALARLERRTGHPAAARERLEKGWRAGQGDVRFAIELVRLHLAGHRPQDALAVARQVQQHHPQSALGYLLAGLALDHEGRRQRAVEELEKAVARQPDSLLALSALVSRLLAEQRYAEAGQRVTQALSRHPDDPLLHLLQGRIAQARGDLAAAEASFRRASTLRPDWSGAWLQLARVQARAGNREAAQHSFERGLQGDPHNYALRAGLAVLQERSGQRAAATRAYRRLLAENPHDVLAANNLALLLIRDPQGDADGKDLDRLLSVLATVDHPEIWDTRGWIELQRGHLTQAVNLLRRAVLESPHNGGFRYHLAKARLAQGDRKAARRHLAIALQHPADLEPDERADARQLLRSLDETTADH